MKFTLTYTVYENDNIIDNEDDMDVFMKDRFTVNEWVEDLIHLGIVNIDYDIDWDTLWWNRITFEIKDISLEERDSIVGIIKSNMQLYKTHIKDQYKVDFNDIIQDL